MGDTRTTTLGRRWLLKMSIFTVLCAGFALYSLYDAVLAYPARARQAASLALYNYLDTATQQGTAYPTIEAFEPRAELARLQALREAGTLTPLDQHKHTWLEQTALAGDLDKPAVAADVAEVRADPRQAYESRKGAWQTGAGGKAPHVAALSWYDIPVQWALFVACGTLALYLLGLLLVVARQKYLWEPGEQRLTLPDGVPLVPADVEDFDKRRWDKFLIFLKIRTGHGPHAGRELKLDLYRHHPLEEWVLAMERTAFPERSAPPPAPQGA